MNTYTIEEKAYKYRHFLILFLILALTFDGCDPEPQPCITDACVIARDGTTGGGMP